MERTLGKDALLKLIVRDEQEKFLFENRDAVRSRIRRRLQTFTDDDATYFIEKFNTEIDTEEATCTKEISTTS